MNSVSTGSNPFSKLTLAQMCRLVADLLIIDAKGEAALRKLRKNRRCNARTRSGLMCQAKVVEGRTRCRWHGGASTGPRTPEGKAAIAESNRRRALSRQHDRAAKRAAQSP